MSLTEFIQGYEYEGLLLSLEEGLSVFSRGGTEKER